MFVLHPEEFRHFSLSDARRFVLFWRQFYRDSVKVFSSDTRIDYYAEIELGRPLTAENVRRLLRWKDAAYLTEVIMSGAKKGPNRRVDKVIEHVAALNAFRRGTLSETTFLKCATSIFPTGWIWRLFLFHIARPLDYPIVDQHVFRSYCWHTGDESEPGWEMYERYRRYFDSIVAAAGQTDESPLQMRKHADDALLAFGQFLKRYAPMA